MTLDEINAGKLPLRELAPTMAERRQQWNDGKCHRWALYKTMFETLKMCGYIDADGFATEKYITDHEWAERRIRQCEFVIEGERKARQAAQEHMSKIRQKYNLPQH